MTIAGARETVGSPVVATKWDTVALTGKGFGHYARECRKPKRDTDEEMMNRNWKAHYSYMAQKFRKGSHLMNPVLQVSIGTAFKESKRILIIQELKESAKLSLMRLLGSGEATSSRIVLLIALQTKQNELEKYRALNDTNE
ncbi:hypothetical protein Tco_1080707 [Tanacetum coccineum]|uniref:Uncharacterized protein n=1 Tax=Tanacetum coccineum TaxID=301880 RepID=A0ABQ5HVG3_9ASTR